MAGVIDMQIMRYLNLFEKITRVRTNHCFKYNEAIYFCVPAPFISKAIGKNATNIKNLNEILGRKIKVIPTPRGEEDARSFIENIVSPVVFKDLQNFNNEIVITGSTQSKASLIGRNKRRFLEMQKIVKDFFGKEFRIA
jgi:NusA-like KH domain protein